VRHVEVAAEDHGFFLFQTFEVTKKIAIPLLAVGEPRQFALGVGNVNIDEKKVGELGGEHAAFLVVLGDADVRRDLQRTHPGKNGGAGITFLLRGVPIRRVGRGPELFDVVGAAFGFLKAKHVGFLSVEKIEEIFPQHGAQAIDIPGNQFHGGRINHG